MVEIVNPFKQAKKIDWSKKTEERLVNAKESEKEVVQQSNGRQSELGEGIGAEGKKKKAEIRVTKSFKVYPGRISREFEKRVNKLQVKFDDLDYDKTFVDSGKYLMFLMDFAEKFAIYELYTEPDTEGRIVLDKEKVIEHMKKL